MAQAGVRRVNISLDSLRPHRYTEITRRGRIDDVFAGLLAARRAGMAPIKLNVVLIPGVNDDEVEDFARFAVEWGVTVRFIERMPFQAEHRQPAFVAEDAVKARIAALFPLHAKPARVGQGPATEFTLGPGPGGVGFISSRTHPFCSTCRRLRLTANGLLMPCLDSPEGKSVRHLHPQEIRTIIQEMANQKQAWGKRRAEFRTAEAHSLSDIGG